MNLTENHSREQKQIYAIAISRVIDVYFFQVRKKDSNQNRPIHVKVKINLIGIIFVVDSGDCSLRPVRW